MVSWLVGCDRTTREDATYRGHSQKVSSRRLVWDSPICIRHSIEDLERRVCDLETLIDCHYRSNVAAAIAVVGR